MRACVGSGCGRWLRPEIGEGVDDGGAALVAAGEPVGGVLLDVGAVGVPSLTRLDRNVLALVGGLPVQSSNARFGSRVGGAAAVQSGRQTPHIGMPSLSAVPECSRARSPRRTGDVRSPHHPQDLRVARTPAGFRPWPSRTADARWCGRSGSSARSGWTAGRPARVRCPRRWRERAACPGRRPPGR